jgi:hypothetical protein
MLLTVEGIYKDGKIEIEEKPADIKQSKVLITFLSPQATTKHHRMVYGQFMGKRMSTDKDFLIAEWHTNQY